MSVASDPEPDRAVAEGRAPAVPLDGLAELAPDLDGLAELAAGELGKLAGTGPGQREDEKPRPGLADLEADPLGLSDLDPAPEGDGLSDLELGPGQDEGVGFSDLEVETPEKPSPAEKMKDGAEKAGDQAEMAAPRTTEELKYRSDKQLVIQMCPTNHRAMCSDPHCDFAAAAAKSDGDAEWAKKIEQGEIRIGTKIQAPHSPDKVSIKWYHAVCRIKNVNLRQKKGAHQITSPKDLCGFEFLDKLDQIAIAELIKMFSPDSSEQDKNEAWNRARKCYHDKGYEKIDAALPTRGKKRSLNEVIADAGKVNQGARKGMTTGRGKVYFDSLYVPGMHEIDGKDRHGAGRGVPDILPRFDLKTKVREWPQPYEYVKGSTDPYLGSKKPEQPAGPGDKYEVEKPPGAGDQYEVEQPPN